MLYHSFPRDRDANPSGKDIKILENILRYGLLLVPEIISYPGKTGKKTGGFNLVQCRFCLTAINDTALLKKHAEKFGAIHLEFTEESIYEIGAIPVMYVPKAPDTTTATTSLWHLAATFIHRLNDFRIITTMLELLDAESAKYIHEKEITVTSRTGTVKEIDAAQLRDILELILERTVNIHDETEKKKKEYSQIQGAIQAICSLFYFTDNERPKEHEEKLLHYFRQHEWRIVQGMSVMESEQDRELIQKEQEAVLDVDSGFFTKKLGLGIPGFKFDSGKEHRIIDLCRILPAVNGKPIQSYIRQIYVPDERYNKALAVAEKNNFPAEKIVPYDKEQGIPNNTQGAMSQRC